MGHIVKYEHHVCEVSVDENLKGRHREHCLCYRCSRFAPANREQNCPIANTVYSLCVLQNLTLPVWECPSFVSY